MIDKAVKMQISVGFLDPDLFTSTNISQRSHQVGKAISNAMNNCNILRILVNSNCGISKT
jgi:hypothetical protein